jgi:hypothetical protein
MVTALLIPGGADLVVAVATVDRPVTTGLEGYFSIFATFNANNGKHLTAWPESKAAILLALFPRPTT